MRGRVNSFPPHGRHVYDAFPGPWASPVQTAAYLGSESNFVVVL